MIKNCIIHHDKKSRGALIWDIIQISISKDNILSYFVKSGHFYWPRTVNCCNIDPMLVKCWATVYDIKSTLDQCLVHLEVNVNTGYPRT